MNAFHHIQSKIQTTEELQQTLQGWRAASASIQSADSRQAVFGTLGCVYAEQPGFVAFVHAGTFMTHPVLARSRRVRRTPFTERVTAAGVKAYTVYNHMLLPA